MNNLAHNIEQIFERVTFKVFGLKNVRHGEPANDNEPVEHATLAEYYRANIKASGAYYQPASTKSWWLP
jgi:hypothetical protein